MFVPAPTLPSPKEWGGRKIPQATGNQTGQYCLRLLMPIENSSDVGAKKAVEDTANTTKLP